MRREVELELEAELRGYYTHYPLGHGMVDYHPEWRRGTEIWNKITKLSSKLNDSHKTLAALQEKLKAEGLIQE